MLFGVEAINTFNNVGEYVQWQIADTKTTDIYI